MTISSGRRVQKFLKIESFYIWCLIYKLLLLLLLVQDVFFFVQMTYKNKRK